MRITIEISSGQGSRTVDEHADVVLRTIRAALVQLPDTRVSGVTWNEK